MMEPFPPNTVAVLTVTAAAFAGYFTVLAIKAYSAAGKRLREARKFEHRGSELFSRATCASCQQEMHATPITFEQRIAAQKQRAGL